VVTGWRRRRFISTAARAAGGFVLAPALLRRESGRPSIACGTASGDVTSNRAVVWSCTDRPARMLVDWATTESFQDAGQIVGPTATGDTGFTAHLNLFDLPRGQRIFYRVVFEDLSDSRNLSLPSVGSFLSAPAGPRDVTFAWSADTVGQGWGINPEWGGLKVYEAIRRTQPDFFIHCGDTIYADNPLLPEVRLPDGTTWRNLVTPAKSKVAETLDEFRGNHRYNLLDDNLRRFNAEVPQIVLWDDHDVRDNWYPQQTIRDDPRYTIKSVATLSTHSRRAFLEHMPIHQTPGTQPPIYRSIPYGPLLNVFALDLRSYRGPNSPNRQTSESAASALAGAQQIRWLKGILKSSTATWKIIASDLPLGLIVHDGDANFEAFANTDGPPLGRELEIADLLRFIRRNKIQNVVWLTADVHYAAAHHYDPARAVFKNFNPFWEFVAGPLHAATCPPSALDNTFGPEVRFNGVPATLTSYPGPSAGLQFFGTVNISAATSVMSVRLHKLNGEVIYTVDLEPER
jgi:alkaline phosphatase D